MPTIEVSQAAGMSADSRRLLLAIDATPGVRSERILTAFGHAGWAVPQGAELERWTAMARANCSGSRSRIAFLRSAGGGIAEELLGAYGTSVVVAIEADGGEDERVWQEVLAGSPLALLYCRPEAALLQAMHEGRSPAAAMDDWIRSARSVIAAYRGDREHVVLIDAERALASPAAFTLACRKRLGIEIPGGVLSADAEFTRSAGDELYRLLAREIVTRSAEASELVDELDECSLPMGIHITTDLDCDLILGDQQARVKREERLASELSRMRGLAVELDERNEGLEVANAALYRQLRSVQEAPEGTGSGGTADVAELQRLRLECEALTHARDEQAATIERLNDELDRFQAERTQAQIRLSRFEEEQELLGLQLAQTQEELEATAMQIQELRLGEAERTNRAGELEASLKQLKQQRDKLQHKLERAERLRALRERRLSYIENSRSWRMTAPLRGARRLFRTPSAQTIAS